MEVKRKMNHGGKERKRYGEEIVKVEDENEQNVRVCTPREKSSGREIEREERMEIAENECETDRRLCAETADGLGSSRARQRNTAFVLPAVCLPAFFVCLHVCLPFCLPVGLFGKAHQYAPVPLMSFHLFSPPLSIT